MNKVRKIREPRELVPVPDMLHRASSTYPDSIAIQKLNPEGTEFEKWSYQEIIELIRTRSAEIKSRGIGKGDRVALYGENSPEWIVTYMAILWSGAICVPIDKRLSYREIHHLINNSEAELFYAQPNGIETEIKDIIPLELPKTIVERKVSKPEPLDLDEPAAILYTSGTTGSPKGAVLTHRNISSNVEMLYETMEFYPDEPFYALLPLHHVFAQNVAMIAPLSNGSTVTIARSFKSKEIQEDCQMSKPVIFPVVPLILEKFVEGVERNINKLKTPQKLAFRTFDAIGSLFNNVKEGSGGMFYSTIRKKLGMENIRYLVSGGAPLPHWVSEKLTKWGFPIIQGYGLTETSPVISINPPESPRNKSVGQILPNLEVEILNPNEEGIGEIAVKGPSVFNQYWKNEEATAEKFEDDLFKTGDMGYFDNDDFLYVTGRKKSVIVTSGGKNIYPEEIESYLSQSPQIEEVLVLYGTNPKTQKKELISIIYPDYEEIDRYREKNKIKEEDPHKILTRIIKKMNKDLADYKRIRRIKLRDEEFPKTTTEKIKRYLFEEEGVEV